MPEVTDPTGAFLRKLSTLITLFDSELKRFSRLEERLGKVNTETELYKLM